MDMKIEEQLRPVRESFKDLGFIRGGAIDDDVSRRIGVRWVKWRIASGKL